MISPTVIDHGEDIQVLPGVTVPVYLATCQAQHPRLFGCINPSRASAEQLALLYTDLGKASTHFEGKLDGGRGDAYREAQNVNFLSRSTGFLQIFDLAASGGADSPDKIVLDALGGNGTLTRIVRACRSADQLPYIVTGDASARMIESALAQGLPAIRQPLQSLIWFDDCTFDAVIVAYGTHHIPPVERTRALSEAYRVLKPGGHIVIQDFEVGCPTTRWYSDTLDRFTLTGHNFEYFTRRTIESLLLENAFADVKVLDVYDPIVCQGESPESARRTILNYVFTLFALDKLLDDHAAQSDSFFKRLESIVRESSTFEPGCLPDGIATVNEFSITAEGLVYRAEIPRVCLVATGRRPAAPTI